MTNQKTPPQSTEEPQFHPSGGIAPTIFVDGFQGVQITNNAVKIGLYQIIQDFSDATEKEVPLKKVIVGRLAMSPETLIRLHLWLGEIIQAEKIESKDGQGA